VLDAAAFRGRRILVTGHTGFKGAWLALWLSEWGAAVTGYALPPLTTPSLFDAAEIRARVRHVEGDIRDRDALGRVMRDSRPEIVFHLAAQAIVREGYRDPVGTLETNVLGTVNLLDAVRLTRSPASIVIVTSDKCYDTVRPGPYRETDPIGGDDVYSASKAAAELITASYRRSFFPPERLEQHGVAVASARAGNVIGGGDWASDRLVPDAIRALAANQTIEVRRPRAVRPWQHVLESLSGYLTLSAALSSPSMAVRREAARAWNFGPDATAARTVADVADALIRAYGTGRWRDTGEPGPHETDSLTLDSSRARAELAWSPRWSFDQTIASTVEWYRAFHAGVAADHLCVRQLAEYCGAVNA
jgi:CDP-glucose 4,6-dehydratase